MNIAELHEKLITAARSNVPGDAVPYAFEKRVMALLASRRAATDNLALWARGLWQAAASCIVIALLVGAWVSVNPASGTNTEDLSQNFENTLLASVDQSIQAQ